MKLMEITQSQHFGLMIWDGVFVFEDIPSTITQQQFTQLMRMSYPYTGVDFTAEYIWEHFRRPPDETTEANITWKKFVKTYPSMCKLQLAMFGELDDDDDQDQGELE